uniref:Chromosome 3 open reading frame 49 n=1 Tax=Microcebus murinus TaxID=30608 RepID=A0A8C5V4X2_MICMU
MAHPQLSLPEPFKVAYEKVGQSRRLQQLKKKNGSFKRKGIERWHRAVSTNLVKQNVLVPKEESSSDSDIGFHESQQNQKKNLMKKMKTALGRMLSYKHRSKPATTSKGGSTDQKEALLSNMQSLLLRGGRELSSPKLFTKPKMRKLAENATIQLDVVEAETEEITQGNTLLRARRTTKRLSVTSLPSGLQKVPYSPKKRPHFPALKKKKHGMKNILRKSDLSVGKLQMQVDDLIETVADKSMKLLAQRHAELQQCEFLGDEILQSSKQFQRISKRTMRKYKLKNVCFPFTCCCF